MAGRLRHGAATAAAAVISKGKIMRGQGAMRHTCRVVLSRHITVKHLDYCVSNLQVCVACSAMHSTILHTVLMPSVPSAAKGHRTVQYSTLH